MTRIRQHHWLPYLHGADDQIIVNGYLYRREMTVRRQTYVHCSAHEAEQCGARGVYNEGTRVFRYTSRPDRTTHQQHSHPPNLQLRAQSDFIGQLYDKITHCLISVRTVYTNLAAQPRYEVVAEVITWDYISSTAYRWRRNMALPLLNGYRAVRRVLASPDWEPLRSLEHTILSVTSIDSLPSNSTGLMLTDFDFLRTCPFTELYFGNCPALSPTLGNTQNVLTVAGRVAERVYALAWILLDSDAEHLYDQAMQEVRRSIGDNHQITAVYAELHGRNPVRQEFAPLPIQLSYNDVMKVILKSASDIEGINFNHQEHMAMILNLGVIIMSPGIHMIDALYFLWSIMPPPAQALFGSLIRRFYSWLSNDIDPERLSIYKKSGSFHEGLLLHDRKLRHLISNGKHNSFWNLFIGAQHIIETKWQAMHRIRNGQTVSIKVLPPVSSCVTTTDLTRFWRLFRADQIEWSDVFMSGRRIQYSHIMSLLHNADYRAVKVVLPREEVWLDLQGRRNRPDPDTLFRLSGVPRQPGPQNRNAEAQDEQEEYIV